MMSNRKLVNKKQKKQREIELVLIYLRVKSYFPVRILHLAWELHRSFQGAVICQRDPNVCTTQMCDVIGIPVERGGYVQ